MFLLCAPTEYIFAEEGAVTSGYDLDSEYRRESVAGDRILRKSKRKKKNRDPSGDFWHTICLISGRYGRSAFREDTVV